MVRGDHEMLEKIEIASRLQNKEFFEVEVRDQVTSTNTLVKEKAMNGQGEGYVLFANCQTQGRGRLGRNYHSPKDTGLYFSMLLRPHMTMEEVNRITTIAAVAVAEAIEEIAQVSAKIKWVNDIYINDKKVCGILTEGSFATNGEGMEFVVVGIGINVSGPLEGFPVELRDIATSLFESTQYKETRENKNKIGSDLASGGSGTNKEENFDIRNILGGACINHFWNYYRELEAQTNTRAGCSNDYIEEYRRRSYLDGREVLVIKPEGEYLATAIGVDEKCQLLVEYSDGRKETLFTGEVSIRVAS